MTRIRVIRLVWRKGIGANPAYVGDWFQDGHGERQFLRLLVQQRCAAWGEGSHWIEEGEIDVETAPRAGDSDDGQSDTDDVLS
jgi:hypothetical protein